MWFAMSASRPGSWFGALRREMCGSVYSQPSQINPPSFPSTPQTQSQTVYSHATDCPNSHSTSNSRKASGAALSRSFRACSVSLTSSTSSCYQGMCGALRCVTSCLADWRIRRPFALPLPFLSSLPFSRFETQNSEFEIQGPFRHFWKRRYSSSWQKKDIPPNSDSRSRSRSRGRGRGCSANGRRHRPRLPKFCGSEDFASLLPKTALRHQ